MLAERPPLEAEINSANGFSLPPLKRHCTLAGDDTQHTRRVPRGARLVTKHCSAVLCFGGQGARVLGAAAAGCWPLGSLARRRVSRATCAGPSHNCKRKGLSIGFASDSGLRYLSVNQK